MKAISLLVGSILVVSGCAGSSDSSPDDSAGVTTDAPASTSSPPTTEGPAVTEASSSTSSPATTEAPAVTEASTSTSSPATTEAPASEAPATEEAVSEGLEMLYDSYIRCLAALPDCDVADLSSNYVDPQLGRTVLQVAGFVDQGWEARNADSRTFTLLSVAFGADNKTAEVTVCEEDDTVAFVAADPETGAQEEIVNDDFISTIQTYTMVNEDGRWKAADLVIDTTTIGEDNTQCV